MTGSVALDVVIGLVFIYLLYSLFATLVAEIISTNMMLRAKNLREAINRMINDEQTEDKVWFPRLAELFNISPKEEVNALIQRFYDHQEVKYLGRKAKLGPSAIKASNFSKVIFDRIKELGKTGATEIDKIQIGLKKLCETDETSADYVETAKRILGAETAAYVQSILEDCQNDVDKFRQQLENWFDRTMEQTTEWYKQRMQKILLIIGFCMAWFFNVDTFTIVKRLSVDKDAREKMVQMASAYIENNSHQKYGLLLSDSLKIESDTLKLDSISKQLITDYNTRMDSLMNIKKELQKDIASANSVLGLGSWLPDSLQIKNKKIVYPEWVNVGVASRWLCDYDQEASAVQVKFWQKLFYMFGLLFGWPRFLGYFITALAISLGAPFWFDMLNKLMKLRGAAGSAPGPPATTTNKSSETPNRVG